MSQKFVCVCVWRGLCVCACVCVCVRVSAQGGISVNKDCCVKSLWQALTESSSKWVWRTERSPARAETVPHFCNLRECPLLQLLNTAKKRKTQTKQRMTYMHNSPKSTDSSCWCELTPAEWAAGKQAGITRKWSLEADDFSPMLGHMLLTAPPHVRQWKREKVSFTLQEVEACTWYIACPTVCLRVCVCVCVCSCWNQPWSVSDGFEIHMLVLSQAQYKWSSQVELSSLTGCVRTPLLSPDRLDLHLPPCETGRRRNEQR